MATTLRDDDLYHPTSASIATHLVAVGQQPVDDARRHLRIAHRVHQAIADPLGRVELAEAHVLRHAAAPDLVTGGNR